MVSLDITNDDIGDGFGVCSGTSQAAPHVTAAAAMMLALDPTLRSEEIEEILKETATGAGEMDLESALERVAAELPDRSENDRNRKLYRAFFRKQLQEQIHSWK